MDEGDILDVHSDLLHIVEFLEKAKTDSDLSLPKPPDVDIFNSQTQPPI